MNGVVKELYCKSVYFDLPYLVFVKDNFRDKTLEEWVDAYIDEKYDELPYSPYAPHLNEPGYTIIGGAIPVYLPPDDLSETYDITLGSGVSLGVQFLRRINQKSTIKMCGEVIGDRTGRSSFSSVRVIFDLKDFDTACHWDMRLFCSLAIDAVNKFVEHYRVIANRFYIRPVTAQVIQSFTIFNTFSDRTTSTQYFGSASGPAHLFGGAIDNDKDMKLREVLLTQTQPPIVETLNLEVKDKLDLGEWRLAIIESAVLFEVWINVFLRSSYEAIGVSGSEINKKFLKKDKHGTPLSVYAIAKTLVLDAVGFDFGNTIQFSNWCNYVKDVRNDIVHGKKHYASEQEAKRAYNSVCDAISIIRDKGKK